MGGVILGLSHFFLHVSPMGELPALSAHELSIGVNVPEALSTEVLKAAYSQAHADARPSRF